MHPEPVFGCFRLLLGATIVAVSLTGCELVEKHASPEVFFVPASYSGWVVVEYSDPGAPPLPVVAGKRVLWIPPSGFLTTSSPMEFGIQHSEFYSVAADGTQVRLEDVDMNADIGTKAAEMIFDRVVVCCGHYGDFWEAFYVGHGPAGYDVPDRPKL